QHRLVEVDADTAIVDVRKQLKRPARTRAEVKQQLDPFGAQRFPHGRLDLGLGHVQSTDAIPIGCVCAAIGLGRSLALGLNLLGALAVADISGILDVHRLHQCAGESTSRPVSEPTKHPAPLAHPLDEAGFSEKLYVSADARLALAKNVSEIFDVELTF